jgi:hypothetical protein
LIADPQGIPLRVIRAISHVSLIFEGSEFCGLVTAERHALSNECMKRILENKISAVRSRVGEVNKRATFYVHMVLKR